MPDDSRTPRIFICYRRDDSRGDVRSLRKDLRERLPAVVFFQDVASILPGSDFVDVISAELARCDVVIPVIGTSWLDPGDDGEPRIYEAGDYVRIELEAALNRPTITIVPVLVGGAKMPDQDSLPETLKPLARKHAIELSDEHWDDDTDRLAHVLADAVGVEPVPLSGSGASLAGRLQSVAPHAFDEVGAGPWDAIGAKRELLLVRATGTSVVAMPFGTRDEYRHRCTVRSSVRGLKIADDGAILVLHVQNGLVLRWLNPDGEFIDDETSFTEPLKDARLLGVRASGSSVEVLLAERTSNLCFRLSRGSRSQRPAPEERLRSAAATDDGFATVDLDGRLSRWPDPTQPLEQEVAADWVDVDAARGRDVTLAAGIGRHDDVWVLYATRSDAEGSALRRMALNGRCNRVVVARTAGAYGSPSKVLVEKDRELLVWSWDELPSA